MHAGADRRWSATRPADSAGMPIAAARSSCAPGSRSAALVDAAQTCCEVHAADAGGLTCSIPADLVEEVVRLAGYDTMPSVAAARRRPAAG